MNDKIFLLSKEEYENYRYEIPQLKTYWWLRTTENPIYAYMVSYDGSIDKKAMGMILGVRPVIRISASDNIINVNESIILHAGATWMKIDADLYIAENPIAFKRFNKNYSDYKTSEIRQFLLYWYNGRKEW